MFKNLVLCFGFCTALIVLAGAIGLQNGSIGFASNYTEQDLENAFEQRDKAIEIIVNEVTSLRERIAKLEGKKNEKNTK